VLATNSTSLAFLQTRTLIRSSPITPRQATARNVSDAPPADQESAALDVLCAWWITRL